jgi:hypothetical protein
MPWKSEGAMDTHGLPINRLPSELIERRYALKDAVRAIDQRDPTAATEALDRADRLARIARERFKMQ